MEPRRLGRQGSALSVIGFGAWAIGGGGYAWGWGEQDDAVSIAAIRRALELGVNWIDTAPSYGLGRSEEIVGRAVQGLAEHPFIATKWGKVRYIGVSNFDIPLIRCCLAGRHVDSLQPPYSLLVRGVEDELLPFCATQGIGVVAYSPMQSGLLSGRFDPARLGPDDWRRHDQASRPPLLQQNLAFVERLRANAARRGKTPGQLAIGWVLRRHEVTSAIVGVRRS